jgi:hypothetical protein
MYIMPGRGKWIVVVDNNYIDEINKAPDEILSFEEAIEDVGHPSGRQLFYFYFMFLLDT